jgi:hypothetical protein
LPPELVKSFLGVLGFEDATVTYHDQQYEGRPHRLSTVVARRTRPFDELGRHADLERRYR